MCGISILIDNSRKQIPENEIKAMNKKVVHRGPDGEGYYFDEHLALGHRALKITDPSETGLQPVYYKEYVLIFNGEIYNHQSLRSQLGQEGYAFKSKNDSEVIAAAYDKWGIACTNYFIGMWAFALYDRTLKKLFCSRDRFGIKPFCYTQLGSKFLAGSEIKQFTVFPNFKPIINQSVAVNFLVNAQLNHTTESFFKNVNFLPAGHHLIYDLTTHTFEISKWYNIEKAVASIPKKKKFEEALNHFNILFRESVQLHAKSDLPVSSCLSGGLDSTSIVGVLSNEGNAIHTFSSCYVQEGYNEVAYINDSIKEYNCTAVKIYPNINELIDAGLLRKVVYHQDQPILGGSFFSEYKVFEAVAHNSFRVLLSGQGADEYLGGYREFTTLSLLSLLRKGKLLSLRNSLRAISHHQKKSFKAILKEFLLFGLAHRYVAKKDASSYNNQLYRSLINTGFNVEKDRMTGVKNCNFFNFSSLKNLSKAAITEYSLPHQLHSEDRNAMLHSIESRLPFLDHRLIEYCLSLPDDFIVRTGVTKALLRESCKNILPESVYNRHSKLGFPGPEEHLFIHHYHYIQQCFQKYEEEYPEIFTQNLTKVHNAFHKNQIPYNSILFRALSFGMWCEEFGMCVSDNKKTPCLKSKTLEI
jgi:asparagine synthase (glutamine-hydrolysing)